MSTLVIFACYDVTMLRYIVAISECADKSNVFTPQVFDIGVDHLFSTETSARNISAKMEDDDAHMRRYYPFLNIFSIEY